MKKILVLALTLALPLSLSFAEGDAEKGKATFQKLCSQCHGPEGAGDGPIAQSLPANQKPASLKDGEFKFATDEEKMKELLKKGGAGVGLSPLMPPQPSLSDEEVANLIAFVQSLKK